jgi:hypothetical protein
MRPPLLRVQRLARCISRALAATGLLLAEAALSQPQLVSPDQGRFRVNGYVEAQIRALADDLEPQRGYLSQWATILDLEPELDIAPDGWGPFDLISAFARIEARFECIFSGCGLSDSYRNFGEHSGRSPARNWADGDTLGYVGGVDLKQLGFPVRSVQPDSLELLNITANPGFQPFYDVGIAPETVEAAFGRTARDVFSWKSLRGPREPLAVPLGPWSLDSTIRPRGALRNETSTVKPLPLRPEAGSLFTPSEPLRRRNDGFGAFDQDFSQNELQWNHGASQDEWELKELYLDLELFDSRLWVRVGKQNIVWGKTELFRTTDQFNPVDIGLASLPSLEESRIALWSVRGVWSFFEVGPLEDVRLELAANYDDFEPVDLGRCAEPYAVWPVCVKTTLLWSHGTLGAGLAGEVRPPYPWDDTSGIELGARLEFRWSHFSFALMDFYGYEDVPTLEQFHSFERNVDVSTGRPLTLFGDPLTPDNALAQSSGNRQGFDVGCKASLGFGDNALLALTGGLGTVPDLSQTCIGDVVNLPDPLEVLGLEVTVPNAFGALLAGQAGGQLLFSLALGSLGISTTRSLVPLIHDPNDGPNGGGFFGDHAQIPAFSTSNLSYYLTDQQEALLGCGPFFDTDCDVDGIDFYNSEGSVLVQSFPGFESNPVATRYVDGQVVILPGARGPGDADYDVDVDGTPPPGFDSEMAALSANFALTIAALGVGEGDTDCDLDDLATCAGVRAIEALTGSQRPELRAGGNGRFGRRDWSWHGGGEAQLVYPKRNVLGFSADFAEDRTKTVWNTEFTWIGDATFADNRSRSLTQEVDVYNLTVSIDRPTFVNFLNPNRTFFLNTQIFFRYLPAHDSSFDTNGPLTALATFSVATGYFQDRLLPFWTFVHDFSSASGGIITQLTYRFSESFSATFGVLGFYGGPGKNRIPRNPLALFDTQTSFRARTRYEGLSAISERDELFLRVRYTF